MKGGCERDGREEEEGEERKGGVRVVSAGLGLGGTNDLALLLHGSLSGGTAGTTDLKADSEGLA